MERGILCNPELLKFLVSIRPLFAAPCPETFSQEVYRCLSAIVPKKDLDLFFAILKSDTTALKELLTLKPLLIEAGALASLADDRKILDLLFSAINTPETIELFRQAIDMYIEAAELTGNSSLMAYLLARKSAESSGS